MKRAERRRFVTNTSWPDDGVNKLGLVGEMETQTEAGRNSVMRNGPAKPRITRYALRTAKRSILYIIMIHFYEWVKLSHTADLEKSGFHCF